MDYTLKILEHAFTISYVLLAGRVHDDVRYVAIELVHVLRVAFCRELHHERRLNVRQAAAYKA